MKKYKYALTSFRVEGVEKGLNELGEVGWRVVYIEWEGDTAKWLVLVEKEVVDEANRGSRGSERSRGIQKSMGRGGISDCRMVGSR